MDRTETNRNGRRPACYQEEEAEGRPSACGLQSAAKKSLRSRRDPRPGSSLPLALGLGSSEQSPPGHTQHHAAGGVPAPGPDPPSPELESSPPPCPEPSAAVPRRRLLPSVSSTDVAPRQQDAAAAGSPSRIALATAFPCFLRLHSFLPPPASSPLPDEEEDAAEAAAAPEVEGNDWPGCFRRRRIAPRPPSPPLARLCLPAYMQPPRTPPADQEPPLQEKSGGGCRSMSRQSARAAGAR
jgi:hypothetical protein